MRVISNGIAPNGITAGGIQKYAIISVLGDGIVYNRIIIARGSQGYAMVSVFVDSIVQNGIIGRGIQMDAIFGVIVNSIV